MYGLGYDDSLEEHRKEEYEHVTDAVGLLATPRKTALERLTCPLHEGVVLVMLAELEYPAVAYATDLFAII